MATPLAYTARYTYSVEAVRAAFSDEQYWKARIAEVGGPGARLDSFTVDGDQVRVQMVQAIPADQLPPAITAVRPGDLVIPRTETYTGTTGSFEARVEGAPAIVRGTVTLTAEGNVSVGTVTGSIEVKIPLFGSKIEAAISEHLVALLANEAEFTEQWLAR
ncbi:hypothetical protein BOX37_29830 [Nocardia mangyaensis]|uniref:DUF2505 domain-containing protein n=1 Tax=Nocardia mangyaensis TaxID=2213200 RepID=A0A1J0VZA1_9NOCA|nr:DUF2505 domain-containing protein [Nocardia mangyaensis]APE37432.1 hypothetical protein BOX37_29830 [Nocardia mangyaensis]